MFQKNFSECLKLHCQLFVFLVELLGIGFSLTCLNCEDVPLPSLCRTVQQCGPHETCFIEAYISTSGLLKYRQGCRDTQRCSQSLKRRGESIFCDECCQEDLCNMAGCGQKGRDTCVVQQMEQNHNSSVTTSQLCYSCDLQIGPETCDKITQCGRDETCKLQRIYIPGAPPNVDTFRSGCAKNPNCAASSLVPSLFGRRSNDDDCSFCCQGALCNTGPCNNTVHTFAPGTTTDVPTTTPKSHTIRTTHAPAKPPARGCSYNGHIYHEGHTWKDGCRYKCTCTDGRAGFYQCFPLCVIWHLAPQCYLRAPPHGLCCPVPSCPDNIPLYYPPGYVQE